MERSAAVLGMVSGALGAVDGCAPVITTYPTVASLQGAAGSLPRPLSWREMREIAYDDRLATQLGSGE